MRKGEGPVREESDPRREEGREAFLLSLKSLAEGREAALGDRDKSFREGILGGSRLGPRKQSERS